MLFETGWPCVPVTVSVTGLLTALGTDIFYFNNLSLAGHAQNRHVYSFTNICLAWSFQKVSTLCQLKIIFKMCLVYYSIKIIILAKNLFDQTLCS